MSEKRIANAGKENRSSDNPTLKELQEKYSVRPPFYKSSQYEIINDIFAGLNVIMVELAKIKEESIHQLKKELEKAKEENIRWIEEELEKIKKESIREIQEELEKVKEGEELKTSSYQLATKKEVRDAYRFLLRREPESLDMINQYVSSNMSFNDLRKAIWDSEEFAMISGQNRLSKDTAPFAIQHYNADGKIPMIDWVIPGKSHDPISLVIKMNKPFDEVMGLMELFDEPGSFLDIGANIGAYSLQFAAKGWEVASIEASKKNIECIEKSALLNNFEILLGKFAVYEKTGTIYFYDNGPWGYVKNTIIQDVPYEEIYAVALDDYKKTSLAGIKKLDVIKMDIEGSELAVLRGMSNFVRDFEYPPIYCELNVLTLFYQNEIPQTVFSEFGELGYVPYKLNNGNLLRYYAQEGQIAYCTDYLFIHENYHKLDQFIKGDYQLPDYENAIERILEQLSDDRDPYVIPGTCCNLQYLQYANDPRIVEQLIKLKNKKDNELLQLTLSWFAEQKS